MEKLGKWISAKEFQDNICSVFRREVNLQNKVTKAVWFVTARGMYVPNLNGKAVTDAVFMPGWTTYQKRIQFQEYDVTDLLKERNVFKITLGKGWYGSRLGWIPPYHRYGDSYAINTHILITFEDGTEENIVSDNTWETAYTGILFSEIYDGEVFDSRISPDNWSDAAVCEDSYGEELVPQEGEWIKEREMFPAQKIIKTPKNETVIDFGQNLTGYVSVRIFGPTGHHAKILHGEVLDSSGNFYNENLRTAKQQVEIICNGSTVEYKPHFTFQGFRYICLIDWPEDVNLDNFQAIAVYSDMERVGTFHCSNEKLNRLYENILWGQRSNFLDIPTDCPQRDERCGWTGDAQVFIKAASYNFDVSRFFKKWLNDLRLEQFDDGGIPAIVPNVIGQNGASSSAWGDAAVICPWQLYLAYGDRTILEDNFECMRRWVEFIRYQGEFEETWDVGHHFGDWLGLDALEGSYKGSTSENLIATAFYAYSTSLLIKAGKELGRDMCEYEFLYDRIRSAYIREYLPGGLLRDKTQTAHALTLYFDLCDSKGKIARDLADLIKDGGNCLQTGFVGTPYLLHALSENGYEEVAYDLLLRESYPSWLYSVNQGATTMWEHWDGIKPDGQLWSAEMNSFNHYAYGAVGDWLYGAVAGINADERAPGFRHIVFRPFFDSRLLYVKATLKTKYGNVSAKWKIQDNRFIYEVYVPEGCTASVYMDGMCHEVNSGCHKLTMGLNKAQ